MQDLRIVWSILERNGFLPPFSDLNRAVCFVDGSMQINGNYGPVAHAVLCAYQDKWNLGRGRESFVDDFQPIDDLSIMLESLSSEAFSIRAANHAKSKKAKRTRAKNKLKKLQAVQAGGE